MLQIRIKEKITAIQNSNRPGMEPPPGKNKRTSQGKTSAIIYRSGSIAFEAIQSAARIANSKSQIASRSSFSGSIPLDAC
jgi:hypothetical protein